MQVLFAYGQWEAKTNYPWCLPGDAYQMLGKIRGIVRFYVNRFSIFYALTGAVNALMIDGWLYLLKQYLVPPNMSCPGLSPQIASCTLAISTLIAVVTSIFTDYTWKSEVVFRSPLLSRARFFKYFLNGSAATIIQYILTLLLSNVIFYSLAYLVAVAVGFLFAYTISRLRIWTQFVPRSTPGQSKTLDTKS